MPWEKTRRHPSGAPIEEALSDPQAGCRRGYTTSQQALCMSMLLHQYGDGALVCLLDIPKAYPSMPHECLTYGLQPIGTPARIYNMVANIDAHSTGVYGEVRFPLRRGIKEGSRLSPALFVLVYEALRQTLTREFPNSTNLAYVDDIAIISPNPRPAARQSVVCHTGPQDEPFKDTRVPLGPTLPPSGCGTKRVPDHGHHHVGRCAIVVAAPYLPLPWSPPGTSDLGTKGT